MAINGVTANVGLQITQTRAAYSSRSNAPEPVRSARTEPERAATPEVGSARSSQLSPVPQAEEARPDNDSDDRRSTDAFLRLQNRSVAR